MNTEVKILDSTLREGNHRVYNRFSLEDIKKIVKSLDRAGTHYIEVGYGFGFDSYKNSDYPTDREIISTAINASKNSKIAILVFPDKADIEKFEEILDLDIGLIRIAVQSDDVSPAKDFIKLGNKYNKKMGGFLMMASRIDSKKLSENVKLLKSYGSDMVTVTDSAGAMIPSDVSEKISDIKNTSDIEIGFHSHDSIGLAMNNSICAIKNGASIIDASIAGFGAGSGNTRIETLTAALSKMKFDVDVDLIRLLESVNILEDILKKYDMKIINQNANILAGYYGIYAAFAKLIENLSIEHDISLSVMIEEVSKRRFVPGDEIKIKELAKKLTKNKH